LNQLALVARFKSSEGTRNGVIIEGWANKAVVDRGGDLIKKEAWNLDNFQKNAMILYNHDRDKPIGKALAVEPRDEGLYIKARISGSSDPEITKIRDLIKEGILNTFSVGFDCKREEKSADGVNEIKEAELFEVSVVTLPMNQDSTFSVAKKLDDVRTAAMDYAVKIDAQEKEKLEAPVEEAQADVALEEKDPSEEPSVKGEMEDLVAAYHADVNATMTGEGNPAAWVADEELWAKAKEVSQAALGELNYGFITWYYLTHGGTKKGMCEDKPKEEMKEEKSLDQKMEIDMNPYLEQSRQTNILLGTLINEIQKIGASLAGTAIPAPGADSEPTVEVEVETEAPEQETESELPEDKEVAKLLVTAREYFKHIDAKLKTVGV
jgi:HK97 family phage prohead protease